MNENPKSDTYFVELIQLLPVLLEFGDRKLYDTDKFGEYYPELLNEYEIKREDWNEAYYYAIENLLPDPVNQGYERYIELSIQYMVEDDMTSYLSENFDELDTELILKEFYENFRNICHGINAFFDELEERLKKYGAISISPLLLNLYGNQYLIDISAMKFLQENILSGKFKEFSKSFTIKHSEEIRDSFMRSSGDHVPILESRILVSEKDIFGGEGPKMDFYEFLHREFRHCFDTENQPDYNLKIMANLFPLLYYEVIKEETVAEILPLFKPSTARLIKNLSHVNSKNLLDYLQKNSSEDEYKFVSSFLEAELNWHIHLGENPELAIAYYLTQFIDPKLDVDIVDDILSPIYKRQKNRE
jgi:hypothetical protein